MPCHWLNLPGGGVAHIRTSSQQPKLCACGRLSTRLCDYIVSLPEQVTHKKTCDKALCDHCAVHAGPDLDYCREHAEILERAVKP